jgi:hypothetical protein
MAFQHQPCTTRRTVRVRTWIVDAIGIGLPSALFICSLSLWLTAVALPYVSAAVKITLLLASTVCCAYPLYRARRNARRVVGVSFAVSAVAIASQGQPGNALVYVVLTAILAGLTWKFVARTWATGVVIACAIGNPLLILEISDSFFYEDIHQRMPTYIDSYSRRGQMPSDGGSPLIRGRFVIVDIQEYKISKTFRNIRLSANADLRDLREFSARDADEIRTLILEDCREAQVGGYSGGAGKATRWTCVMTMLDPQSGSVLGVKRLLGTPLPTSITVRSGWKAGASGDHPDLLGYLANLPRQPE